MAEVGTTGIGRKDVLGDSEAAGGQRRDADLPANVVRGAFQSYPWLLRRQAPRRSSGRRLLWSDERERPFRRA